MPKPRVDRSCPRGQRRWCGERFERSRDPCSSGTSFLSIPTSRATPSQIVDTRVPSARLLPTCFTGSSDLCGPRLSSRSARMLPLPSRRLTSRPSPSVIPATAASAISSGASPLFTAFRRTVSKTGCSPGSFDLAAAASYATMALASNEKRAPLRSNWKGRPDTSLNLLAKVSSNQSIKHSHCSSGNTRWP